MKWKCFICVVIVFGGGCFIFIFLLVSFKYVRFIGRYWWSKSFSVGSSLRSLYGMLEVEFEGVIDEISFYGVFGL